MPRVQQKRGLKANLPTTGMLAGELYLTTDQQTAMIATAATTKEPLRIDVDLLTTISAITGAEDLIYIWDTSEASVPKGKKISFNDFKTALNIPAGSSDEKAAVVSGGTSGYIWGADGTDGIIRLNGTLSWTKDAGNGFVTIAVETIDCGTF